MRVLLHVALATSLMILGGAATAQEDRVETRAERATAEVIAGLNKFAADPVAVDQAVARAWPMFNDEQRKAYGEHLSWTIQNKAINAHFAGLAKSAVGADFTREQLKMFFMQSATDLQAKGVRRLDDEGIMFYVGSMRRMIEFLPPELCKTALTGQLTTRQTAFMEQKWLSSLDMLARGLDPIDERELRREATMPRSNCRTPRRNSSSGRLASARATTTRASSSRAARQSMRRSGSRASRTTFPRRYGTSRSATSRRRSCSRH